MWYRSLFLPSRGIDRNGVVSIGGPPPDRAPYPCSTYLLLGPALSRNGGQKKGEGATPYSAEGFAWGVYLSLLTSGLNVGPPSRRSFPCVAVPYDRAETRSQSLTTLWP